VFPSGDGYKVESEQGININKLDKGCIIFNIEKDKDKTLIYIELVPLREKELQKYL